MVERCFLCNMEVSSLAIHKKLNHKNVKTSSLKKSSFGFTGKRKGVPHIEKVDDILKTCSICGMDNIVNLEQHTLIKHAIKRRKENNKIRRSVSRLKEEIQEDSNEDEQELAERVKKKLKTFKLQRMFKTMKSSIDESETSSQEDYRKIESSLNNLDESRSDSQCCKCPFCHKLLFYGMITTGVNLKKVKQAVSIHFEKCRPQAMHLMNLKWRTVNDIADESKYLQEKVKIKQEDFSSQDDNVLFKVVRGVLNNKKTCYLIIDGITISWRGNFLADAVGNLLDAGSLEDLQTAALTDTEGYLQVSETVIREREENQRLNQVLDCLENNIKHSNMPTITINQPSSSKTSKDDSSASVIESLEDALKIEVKTDVKILVEDEDILPVNDRLEKDRLLIDESNTEEHKKSNNDEHDKSVEEVEVMKQEMDPCDVFIDEDKESPNVSLDENKEGFNSQGLTNIIFNKILINRDNNTIVFLPPNNEDAEKPVEYNDVSSDTEDSIEILPNKRKTSSRAAPLVDLAEDTIDLSSENDENSIEIFDDDIHVID